MPGSAAIQGNMVIGRYMDVSTTGLALNATATGMSTGKRKIVINYSCAQNCEITVNGKHERLVKVNNNTYTVLVPKGTNKTYTVTLRDKTTNETVQKQIHVMRGVTLNANVVYSIPQANLIRFKCTVGKVDREATGLRITFGGKDIYFDLKPNDVTSTRVSQTVTIGGKEYLFELSFQGQKAIVTVTGHTNKLAAKKITFQQVIADGSSIISASPKKLVELKINNCK